MIDADTRRNNGGIWTANASYSFVSNSSGNTSITLNKTYGSWSYVSGNNGMGSKNAMVWLCWI
jgi:hypothetical protein